MPRAATPPLLRARVRDLQRRLAKRRCAALLVVNPLDIRYLTGFVGDDSWLLVPTRGVALTLLSDSRFEEQIQRESPHTRAVMRKRSLAEELGKLAKAKKIKTLALPADHVTLAQREKLEPHLRGVKLKAIDDGMLSQRAIKTPDEVRHIVKAGKIQQQALADTLAWIRPGVREYEVAAFLEYRMRALGADGVSFPSIVAADANAALPHAIPGPRKLKPGSLVLIDWGAKYKGYCSDMTRVIALGKMKPKLREIYSVVLEAQQAGIDAIRPGVLLRDIDTAARNVIKRAGYGKQFGHGLGHGLGLDIHEEPRLSPLAPEKGVLQPGHVVTVEPGIYLPGVGGVRIEDDVLVTPRGRRVLTHLPKDLDSAIM